MAGPTGTQLGGHRHPAQVVISSGLRSGPLSESHWYGVPSQVLCSVAGPGKPPTNGRVAQHSVALTAEGFVGSVHCAAQPCSPARSHNSSAPRRSVRRPTIPTAVLKQFAVVDHTKDTRLLKIRGVGEEICYHSLLSIGGASFRKGNECW